MPPSAARGRRDLRRWSSTTIAYCESPRNLKPPDMGAAWIAQARERRRRDSRLRASCSLTLTPSAPARVSERCAPFPGTTCARASSGFPSYSIRWRSPAATGRPGSTRQTSGTSFSARSCALVVRQLGLAANPLASERKSLLVRIGSFARWTCASCGLAGKGCCASSIRSQSPRGSFHRRAAATGSER